MHCCFAFFEICDGTIAQIFGKQALQLSPTLSPSSFNDPPINQEGLKVVFSYSSSQLALDLGKELCKVLSRGEKQNLLQARSSSDHRCMDCTVLMPSRDTSMTFHHFPLGLIVTCCLLTVRACTETDPELSLFPTLLCFSPPVL